MFPKEALECLEQSRADSGGEFVLKSLTTEGDRVVHYVRSMPNTDAIEVLTDASGDRFGAGSSEFVCSVPSLDAISLNRCVFGGH
jgi:hypothetical protein